MKYLVGTILRKNNTQDFYIIRLLDPCIWSGKCEFEVPGSGCRNVGIDKLLDLSGGPTFWCPIDLDKEFSVWGITTSEVFWNMVPEQKGEMVKSVSKVKPKRLLRYG